MAAGDNRQHNATRNAKRLEMALRDTLFGGRNVGKPIKVGRTWGYGWGGQDEMVCVRCGDKHAVNYTFFVVR